MNEEIKAENYSGDETATIETPSVDNQTADDEFLAGFSDENIADEQVSEESDSKEDSDEAKESNINNEENKENHSRPEKRSRSYNRIQQLLAENRQKDAELAEWRQWKAEQNKPELKLDEDGNATVEDLAEYNRQLIQQEMEKQRQESENQIREISRQRDLDNSIHTIQSGINEMIGKYSFLDRKSKDYSEEAERIISETVLEQVQQLQASGISDYQEMANFALETVDRQIRLIEVARERAQISASESLRRMSNGGAINSSNHGNVAKSKDEFESIFSSN